MRTSASVPVRLFRAMPPFIVGSIRFAPTPPEANNGVGTLYLTSEAILSDLQVKEYLEMAIAAMQIVAPGQIDVDFARLRIDVAENGLHRVSQDIGGCADIIGHAYTDQEQTAMRIALTSIDRQLYHVEKVTVERSLRWFRLAMAEHDMLQRFVMAWISLEALYRLDDDESNNTLGIHQKIEQIYYDLDWQIVSKRIKKIYVLRNDIFHRADLGGTKLADATKATLGILRDCLADELGLTPTYDGGEALIQIHSMREPFSHLPREMLGRPRWVFYSPAAAGRWKA